MLLVLLLQVGSVAVARATTVLGQASALAETPTRVVVVGGGPMAHLEVRFEGAVPAAVAWS